MSHLPVFGSMRVFGRARALALLATLGLIVALGAVPNGAVAEESPLKQAAKGQIRAPVITTSDGIEREAPFLSLHHRHDTAALAGGNVEPCHGRIGKQSQVGAREHRQEIAVRSRDAPHVGVDIDVLVANGVTDACDIVDVEL